MPCTGALIMVSPKKPDARVFTVKHAEFRGKPAHSLVSCRSKPSHAGDAAVDAPKCLGFGSPGIAVHLTLLVRFCAEYGL